MERRLSLESHFDRALPWTFCAYLALVGLFIADASFFASTTISIKSANVLVLVLLTLGLFAGVRLCRRILAILSITTALGILGVQTGADNLADAMLVAIPVAQAAVLCTPSLRAFTAMPT